MGTRTQRTALIAGALDGPASTIADVLARARWNLALCDARPEDDVTPILQALRQSGSNVSYHLLDIGRREDRFQLLQDVDHRFGVPSLVVGVLATATSDPNPLHVSETEFLSFFERSVRGLFFLAQSVALWMLEQSGDPPRVQGQIIMVEPPVLEGRRSPLEEMAVSALRAGISHLAAALRDEGIVCGIAPFNVAYFEALAQRDDRPPSNGLVRAAPVPETRSEL